MILLALGRFLARTPWSTAMAVIGIGLGVTSIVSVHLISTSISTRLDALVPSQLASYTHFLHRDQLTSEDYFSLRRQWRRGAINGVEAMAPLIDETVELNGRSVRVIGVDLLASDWRGDSDGSTEGNAYPEFSWTGVWIDPTLQGHIDLPVNGVLDAPAGTLIADIAPVQDLLNLPVERISYVGVSIYDPLAELKDAAERPLPGFGAGFPSRPLVHDALDDWEVVSIAEQHPAREFGKSVLFNISALGLLALLVAWLLIYQVSVSWLRRLWSVFERFHVLGVDWHILRLYFVVGMVVLGTLSSLIGLMAGLFLAQWLLAAALPTEPVALYLDGWVIFKGVGSAFGVCLFGGAWAFHRTEQDIDYSWIALGLTGVLMLAAVFCLASPATGLAGGFFSIAVLSLAVGFLMIPLLKRLRRFSGLVKGPYLARLSVREAIWYPQDLSVALAGLTLAVATAIGVGLMIDSFRQDFASMLERRLDYDLIAEGEQQALQELAQYLSTRPSGVTRWQSYADEPLRIKGLPAELRVSRVDVVEAARYGHSAALGTDEALLSEQAARALDVATGDELFTEGALIRVAGVFSSFGDVQPRIIVDRNHALARLATGANSIGIKTGAPDRLLAQINERDPTLSLRLQTEIRQAALDTFDQTFAITTVLITIAMLVATISMYIAVTAMRLNRRTSSRLLVTLGVNRLESVGMDFALGVGVGLIALLIALPLGMAFGWILCSVINPRAFGWTIELKLTLDAMATPMLLGLLAAIAAGLLRGGRSEEGGASALR